MSEFQSFPNVDYPELGDYIQDGRHFRVQPTPEYVHDIFKIQMCTLNEDPEEDPERYSGYLEQTSRGWIAASSLSAIPGHRQESRPFTSWQDALLAWY